MQIEFTTTELLYLQLAVLQLSVTADEVYAEQQDEATKNMVDEISGLCKKVFAAMGAEAGEYRDT